MQRQLPNAAVTRSPKAGCSHLSLRTCLTQGCRVTPDSVAKTISLAQKREPAETDSSSSFRQDYGTETTHLSRCTVPASHPRRGRKGIPLSNRGIQKSQTPTFGIGGHWGALGCAETQAMTVLFAGEGVMSLCPIWSIFYFSALRVEVR